MILVTGARGQLGTEFTVLLSEREISFIGVDLDELDVTDESAVRREVAQLKPDIVINCAAYTAVDKAETEEEKANELNGKAPGYLADAARENSSLLVHFSTDFVFDGKADFPYEPSHPPNPLSAYGRSKLLGEAEVQARCSDYLVLRTSWLYGEHGSNFVKAILKRGCSGETLRVVEDQVGSPSWAANVAQVTLDLIGSGARGVLHVTDRGRTSWKGFAEEILALAGVDGAVEGVSTSDWNAPAPRPGFSVLDTSSTEEFLARELEPWQSALSRFLKGFIG